MFNLKQLDKIIEFFSKEFYHSQIEKQKDSKYQPFTAE